MNDMTKAVMFKTYNKLTKDEYDDLESQFENLDVVWQRVIDWLIDGEGGRTHSPALELQVGELAHDVALHLREAIMQGVPATSELYDRIREILYFGIEIGRLGWPIEKRTCKELHE
jgi:hypothetical protein